ncbi:hypothetical protein ASPTUDRAFT_39271 [Aspergillus tubingensis CBS 134.48]|uniref:Uncharacterized protein n=1 Tax=Aspergillus tubingensis (strain CBS 134.48) TaxID=767770 RepID=A0A1L9NAU9_ASPTC|nr:hypothetical protein ASPTUDRAFT_39271 [Aspergillus tubingensis CBS 134.48]
MSDKVLHHTQPWYTGRVAPIHSTSPHPVTSFIAPITQNEMDICLDPLSQRPDMIYFVPSRTFHTTSDIPEATGRTQQLRPRTKPGGSPPP